MRTRWMNGGKYEGLEKRGARKKGAYWQLCWTACLSAVLFLILCAVRGLFPIGDGSVLMIDLHSQYTPLLYRFYDVVTGQKNLFMDFNVSGGANLYADAINEVINPFNYLLLLFGRDRIYLAINVLLGVYVTAAAVSANFMLLRLWPDRTKWNLVFGLVYGFSGFAAYQFQIIKWMIFPVIFPLYVLAFLRLVRKKKGGWYALLLAWQLMLNLQLGAMTLFSTLFGSGLYFFFCMEREERKRDMCRLAVYTALGAAASAAVLWPGAVYLLKSARGGQNGSYFEVMKQHGLDDLFERLFLTVHPVLLGMFFCGAVKCLVDRIRGRKNGLNCWKLMPGEGRFLVTLNAGLMLTVLAQPSNLLWHLGSYMCFPVRYAYIVLLAAVCLLKWQQAEDEKQREMEGRLHVLRAWHLGCELVSVLLCVSALYLTWRDADQISQAFSTLAISRVCPAQTKLVCMILGVLTAAAVFAFWAGKRRRDAMAIAACASGICLFLFILLPQNYAVRLMNENAYETMNEIYHENQAAAQGTTDAQDESEADGAAVSFSRVPDDEDFPLNAALITGNSTLTGYFPAGSQMVYANGLEQLGYLTPWVSTRSWGGTMISDAVLGLNKEETVLTFGEALVLDESAEVLAEGTESAALGGPLALQAYLGEILTGGEILVYHSGSELYVKKSGNLEVYAEGNQALYLDAGYPADQISVLVNGKKLEIPENISSEGPHRLIYLGTYADQIVQIQVLSADGEPLFGGAEDARAAADVLKVGLLDLEAWEQAADTVSQSRMVKVQKESGAMRIDVRGVEAGQTIFVPAAAIDGWKCTADGEDVEITPVLGGFMGITLKRSAQTLEFTFCPPGLKAGLAVSAAALLILLVACVLVAAKQFRGSEKLTGVLAGCYVAVWAVGVLAVYVVPNVGMVCYMAWRLLKG